MTNTYLDDIKGEMLVHLADRPYTISDLALVMQKPYTTVQQAHKELRAEGKITKFDRRQRNARYTISAETGPNSTIPKIRIVKQDLKPTEIFLGYASLTDQATNAMHDVIKSWVGVARMAQRLEDGTSDFNLKGYLTRKSAMLIQSRNTFEQMAHLCNQLLDAGALWDPEALEKFSLDATWEDYLPMLNDLWDYYYGDNDDS